MFVSEVLLEPDATPMLQSDEERVADVSRQEMTERCGEEQRTDPIIRLEVPTAAESDDEDDDVFADDIGDSVDEVKRSNEAKGQDDDMKVFEKLPIKIPHDEVSPRISMSYIQYKQKLKEDIYEHHKLPSISEDEIADCNRKDKIEANNKVQQEVQQKEHVDVTMKGELNIENASKDNTTNPKIVDKNSQPKISIDKPAVTLKDADELEQIASVTNANEVLEIPKASSERYATSWQDGAETTTTKTRRSRKIFSKSTVAKSVLTDISNNTHISKVFFDDLQYSLPNHLSQKITDRRKKLEPPNPNDLKREILLKQSRVLSKRNILDDPRWSELAEKMQDMLPDKQFPVF